MIRTLEAHKLGDWFDTHSIIEEIAAGQDRRPVEVWIDLLEAGALKINPKALLSAAADAGVSIEAHRRRKS